MNDTIVSIATPPGEGAIAVVRLSGKEAIAMVDKIFKGKKPISKISGGSARFGTIHAANGALIDEVVVTIMRTPHSYTGEDTTEISCHGGYTPSARILDMLISHGARQAERGEFTLRAYLNNRIDLTRAEAVADMVASRGNLAYEAALYQLSGKLYEQLKTQINTLKEILSLTELGIDFAEEDIELTTADDIKARTTALMESLKTLVAKYHRGRVIREGYRVAITGKVNVGKSSLLNALLGTDRAIVTDMPGTTRDSITETVVINGLQVHFTDTAGFRGGTEFIEREGIRRASDIMNSSDLMIILIDPVTGIDDDDEMLFKALPDKPYITVLNKIDLYEPYEREQVLENLHFEVKFSISALTGENLDMLKEAILKSAIGLRDFTGRDIVITNRRHFDCLNNAIGELEKSLTVSGQVELCAEHLRRALNYLGEITGEVSNEEILNSIFDNFCIGK